MARISPRNYALRKPRRERSTNVTIATLLVLALVTAGLSLAALFSRRDENFATGNGDRDSTTATKHWDAETDSSEEVEPTGGATEAVPGLAEPSDRLLAVSDDPERLLRAQGTECGAGSLTIEVSTDGGQTWTESDTSMLELSAVRQIKFGEGGRAQLAFLDQQCELKFADSFVYGGAWEAGANTAGIWTLGMDETAPALLVSGEEVDAPCAVVGTYGVEDTGIVLCDDGSVSISQDGGQSWTKKIAVPGARAVTAEAGQFVVVTSATEDCTGMSVRSIDGDKLTDIGECTDVPAQPEEIAVSAMAGTLFVWADDQILRSDDFGQTWN